MNLRLANSKDIPKLKTMYGKIIDDMSRNDISIWDEIYPCEVFSDDSKKDRLYLLEEEYGDVVAAFALCESHTGESYVKWENPQDKALKFDKDDASLRFLLLPSEYSNSMVHYNALDSNAKSKLIKVLGETFYDLGVAYVPIVITDGYRDAPTQVQRIIDNGLAYYLEKLPKNGNSYPYIKALYDIYITKTNIDVVLLGSSIPVGAKNIIKNNYGNLKGTLTRLIPTYFKPSFHIIWTVWL